MASFLLNIYRYKRVFQEIKYLKSNFSNWDSIIKRMINGKIPKVLIHRNGLEIHGTHMNTLSIYKEIFIKKVYSNDFVKVAENDIVFDIGANVGIFSLFASEVEDTQVYAFEPHPNNFQVLESNVQMNNKDNIKSLNYALGIKNEKRFLEEGVIPGGHRLAENNNNEVGNGLVVEAVTLLKIMEELNIDKIDFLKLDCEGAEGEIIKSLNEESFKKIKKVAIEFHDNNSILTHFEIINILKSNHFETKLVWDGNSYFGYIYGFRIEN